MPLLVSGSQKNSSSPSGFTNLSQAQNQLGPTPTTSTGYTLVATSGSLITYVSSLGNLQFDKGAIYSNVPDQNINIVGTGTSTVIISGSQVNLSPTTGVLVVNGGIGIANGLYTGDDINVNGITIGQGYKGSNNIVLTGVAATQTNSVDFDGENSIAIGWSALLGLQSAQNSIAIGRYALSSGTNLTNTIAIGDSSLQRVGTVSTVLVGAINKITTGTTTTVTVINHGLTTGSSIIISGVTGSLGTNLNGKNYLVDAISANTLTLYTFVFPNDDYSLATNSIYSLIRGVNKTIDSSSFGTGSVTAGFVSRSIVTYSNVAFGNASGKSFYNGQRNFFLGDTAAPNLTTGSFNFFLGYAVSSNMRTGNNNVSINSKLIRDGQDNQVGIGGIFYFDGVGKTSLSSTVFVGDPSYYNEATSSFNNTGALQVYGGAGIKGSVFVGSNLNATGSNALIVLAPVDDGTVTINPKNVIGTIDNMIIGQTVPQTAVFTTATINSSLDSISTSSGALRVVGGVGVGKNVYVGSRLDTNTINARSTAAATSTTNGAVTVAGGMGVQGSIYSQDGNPDENKLLYSPRVTVSTSTPSALVSHIGDFWINSKTLAEYQYIKDGTSTFWIQIAQL